MRLRPERLLLAALVLLVAAWAARPALRAVRWTLVGLVELGRLPAPAPAPRAWDAAPARIAHGGGALGALRTTNTVEALERNYGRGVRWFEVDFLPDSRGAWWAVHDWAQASAVLGVPLDSDGRGLPGEQRSGSAPSVPRLEQVLDWFGRHPDARLVTDTKGDNGLLLRQLRAASPGVRARIHPQLYRLEELGWVTSDGFGAPIFTTYRSAYPWWVLRRFVQRTPLLAVTVSRAEADEACAALCGHIPVLAHTVNDPADAAGLARAGLTGIYTDDLLP
jgi:glycerophosphoryl diester phosphodiesterase